MRTPSESPIRRRGLVALSATALCLASAATVAADEGLIPHLAVYELAVPSRAQSQQVVEATGRLVYSQERTCKDWLIANRMRVILTFQNGVRVPFDANQQLVEGRDGNRLDFRIDEKIADQTIAYSGEARRREDGDFTVSLSGSNGVRSMTLPPETLFPMGHLADVIAAAEAGEIQHAAFTFDGSDTGLFEVTSFIADRSEQRPFPLDPSGEVAEDPSWHFRVGFYDATDPTSEPMMELGADMFAGGVSTTMLLDLQVATLEATAVTYRRLPDPDC